MMVGIEIEDGRSRTRAKAVLCPASSVAKKAVQDADGHCVLGVEWTAGDQLATS